MQSFTEEIHSEKGVFREKIVTVQIILQATTGSKFSGDVVEGVWLAHSELAHGHCKGTKMKRTGGEFQWGAVSTNNLAIDSG